MIKELANDFNFSDPKFYRLKKDPTAVIDALPLNFRPNEIFHYSSRLKTLGGYSYTPSVAKEENPFAKPAEPRKYHPNFLSPFGIPEASEQEPQQEELGPEPPKQDVRKQPQGNPNVWMSASGVICQKVRDGNKYKWVCHNLNGQQVKVPNEAPDLR